MKNFCHLILVFVFSLPTILWAQKDRNKEVDTVLKHQINTVFQNIDKSKVPHGVLLDYAMDFTDVTAYNGTLTDRQVEASTF